MTDPDQQPSAPICPECRAGKCQNCDHVALVDDDRYVTCQCSHSPTPAGAA